MLEISCGCLEGVWKLSGVSGACLAGVWRVSGGCLKGVWKVPGGRLNGVCRVSMGYLLIRLDTVPVVALSYLSLTPSSHAQFFPTLLLIECCE